jgi:hypothetical protein
MELNRELGNLLGGMEVFIMGSLIIIILKGMGQLLGRMISIMRVSGKRI